MCCMPSSCCQGLAQLSRSPGTLLQGSARPPSCLQAHNKARVSSSKSGSALQSTSGEGVCMAKEEMQHHIAC